MTSRSQRNTNTLREISFQRHFTQSTPGSVLVSFGNTKVICTASVDRGVPRFLQDAGKGWLTAEYGMLPAATHSRNKREASRGKQTGRTIEIQRLIGRSLRAALNMSELGENTITIDCDVIQADGGTRTAAISGSCVALVDALSWMQDQGIISTNPLRYLIAAVSVGMVNGEPRLDLDYTEDSSCGTDMNVIMTETGDFIEVQGTAEGLPFSQDNLQQLLTLAHSGIQEIIKYQRDALSQ